MTSMSIQLRASRFGAALAAILTLPLVLAAQPAAADDWRGRRHEQRHHERRHHHHFQHQHRHPPRPQFGFYGYAPPPYAFARPPRPYAYRSPPPYVVVERPVYARSPCRAWNGPVWIDGREEMVFGTICPMPDGTWRLMN